MIDNSESRKGEKNSAKNWKRELKCAGNMYLSSIITYILNYIFIIHCLYKNAIEVRGRKLENDIFEAWKTGISAGNGKLRKRESGFGKLQGTMKTTETTLERQ